MTSIVQERRERRFLSSGHDCLGRRDVSGIGEDFVKKIIGVEKNGSVRHVVRDFRSIFREVVVSIVGSK